MSTPDTTENADPTTALTANPAASATATTAKKTVRRELDSSGGPMKPNRRKTQVKSAARPTTETIVASKVNHENVDVQ